MVKCFVYKSRTVENDSKCSILSVVHCFISALRNILRLYLLLCLFIVLIFMFVWDVYLIFFSWAFAHILDNTFTQCTPSLSSYLQKQRTKKKEFKRVQKGGSEKKPVIKSGSGPQIGPQHHCVQYKNDPFHCVRKHTI